MLDSSLKLGIVFMILAVIIGAFGAHGLETILIENQRVDTFETASKYHFYHAIGLILLGIVERQNSNGSFKISRWLFVLGIMLFSGSLYILSVTNITWLGVITPFGGLSFIIAWVLFLMGASKRKTV